MSTCADAIWPALAALLLLTACMSGAESPPAAVPSPVAVAPPATAPAPATRPRPKPPEPIDLAGLLGTTPDAATARLGAPSGTRDEAPARVMTWRVGACTLDLFFYMDMASRAFRALAWELRPVDGQPAATVCPGPARGPA
ncbi:MAG: hypothetical protein AB7N54_02195 [Alphaproteobacteria bacterium]